MTDTVNDPRLSETTHVTALIPGYGGYCNTRTLRIRTDDLPAMCAAIEDLIADQGDIEIMVAWPDGDGGLDMTGGWIGRSDAPALKNLIEQFEPRPAQEAPEGPGGTPERAEGQEAADER